MTPLMEDFAKRQILTMFETLMAPMDDVAIRQFNDDVTSMCARHGGAHVVKGHSNCVSSVCVTADGAHVVTGSHDGTARGGVGNGRYRAVGLKNV